MLSFSTAPLVLPGPCLQRGSPFIIDSCTLDLPRLNKTSCFWNVLVASSDYAFQHCQSDNDSCRSAFLPFSRISLAAPVRSPPRLLRRRGALGRGRSPFRLLPGRFSCPLPSVPPQPRQTRLLLPAAAARTSNRPHPRPRSRFGRGDAQTQSLGLRHAARTRRRR